MTIKRIIYSFILVLALVNVSLACNTAPVANMIVYPEVFNAYIVVGREITIDATSSYDPDEDSMEYELDTDYNGTFAPEYTENTTGKFTFTPNDSATYRFAVRVKDEHDAYSTVVSLDYDCVASYDTDGDYLPDAWEIANFGDLDQGYSIYLTNYYDFDGDGYNNLCEYLHGTNPNDNQESPGINDHVTFYVPDDVGSIEVAINCAVIDAHENNGILYRDKIIFREGEYLTCNDLYDFVITNDIILSSEDPNDWRKVNKTVIICENQISIEGSNVDEKCTIEGLKFLGDDRDRSLHINYSQTEPTTIEIKNCIFESSDVGAIYIDDSGDVKISNCFFVDNGSTYDGGAIRIDNIDSQVDITNSVFVNNETSDYGGAIYCINSGTLNISSCTFCNNLTGESDSGALDLFASSGSFNIYNSILWCDNSEKQIYFYGGTLTANNSCMTGGWTWGTNPLITYATGTLDTDNNDNFGAAIADPFINSADPVGPDGLWGTFDDGLRLKRFRDSGTGESCIDKADITLTGYQSTDLMGRPRMDILSPYSNYDTGYADVGAYEYQDIIFVDNDSSIMGTRDGKSWATAFEFLQDAVDKANMARADCNEIWVADGDGPYYPDIDSNGNHTIDSRTEWFNIRFVKMYGGFEGYDGTSATAHDWVNNKTILSGDITQDGVFDGDESYRVILLSFFDVEIRGFHITGGNANGIDRYSLGGGIWVYCGETTTVADCNIYNNQAVNGGGIYVDGYDGFRVEDCILWNNSASVNGGGVYCYDGLATPDRPIFWNCFFVENSAVAKGGGLCSGDTNIFAQNCVFYGNVADKGAAVANVGDSYGWFINCTFAENVATTYGSSMYNDIDSDGWVRVINSIMYNDTSPGSSVRHIYNDNGSIATVVCCLIQDGDNYGCMDIDPYFSNYLDICGADDKLGTDDDGLVPTTSWMIVDSADGYNATYYDIAGSPRNDMADIQNRGLANSYLDYVDIGAYEIIDATFQPSGSIIIMCFIDESSESYCGNSSLFETDLEDYDDILLNYTELTVTTGCYVPELESNDQGIYDVLPSSSYTVPSNIFMDTFWEYEDRLQMQKNWFIDAFEDMVGTTVPVAIFLLVDNSGSLEVADLEYHYDGDDEGETIEREDPYDPTKGYSGFKTYLKGLYGDNRVICNDGYEGIKYNNEQWLKWINDLLLNYND